MHILGVAVWPVWPQTLPPKRKKQIMVKAELVLERAPKKL